MPPGMTSGMTSGLFLSAVGWWNLVKKFSSPFENFLKVPISLFTAECVSYRFWVYSLGFTACLGAEFNMEKFSLCYLQLLTSWPIPASTILGLCGNPRGYQWDFIVHLRPHCPKSAPETIRGSHCLALQRIFIKCKINKKAKQKKKPLKVPWKCIFNFFF